MVVVVVAVRVIARWPRGSLKESTAYLEALPPAGRPELGDAVEKREARLAAVALAEDNEQLRREAEELGEQVRQLTVALASVRAEADVLKADLERGELGMTYPAELSDVVMKEELRVLDVNRKLRMVVLDAGSLQGLKPGMTFAVLRGRKAIATLRAVDVRNRVSGAVVEEARRNAFPEKGDRAVAGRLSDR